VEQPVGQGHQERDLIIAGHRAAVLGAPVAHSLSPVLHRAAYQALGLDDWAYEAIECDEARLPGLLESLGPDWAGLSLTMPLKRAVLPLLDWAEPLVAEVAGANTVVFGSGGRLGYNTDVPGMITALAEAGVGPAPDTALVLGAGATAGAALGALRGIGAGEATVAVRDPAAAAPLLAVADRLGLKVRLARFGAEPAEVHWQLLISTVPAGAADTYADAILARALIPAAVLDVVYHPWPTRLASAAAQAGAVTASGFELLLHQAAGQVELMTGREAPTAAMREAGHAALARR
jgi:shikimate dehydrogenase